MPGTKEGQLGRNYQYAVLQPIQSINQSINNSISLIATMRPESRIANDMQLK